MSEGGLEPADTASWIACTVSESRRYPDLAGYSRTRLLPVRPGSRVSVPRWWHTDDLDVPGLDRGHPELVEIPQIRMLDYEI
jgi:hypothetical protein